MVSAGPRGHLLTLASTAGCHAEACPLEAYFWLETSLLQSRVCCPLPSIAICPLWPVLREPHLQHAKGALIAHADQAAESELQDHGALEGDKVPDILQEEVPRPVVVTVTMEAGKTRVAA